MKDHGNPSQHKSATQLPRNPVQACTQAPCRKSSVYALLKGGFGNQLFQYAAGLQLARRLDAELRVDLRWFAPSRPGTDTPRSYDLHHLKLAPTEATRSQLRWFLHPANKGRLQRRLYAYARRISGHTLFVDNDIGFQPALSRLKAPVLLEGYFQSAAHMQGIEDELRQTAVLRIPPPRQILDLSDSLSGCDSVCVQIRRSDYLKSQASADYHGCCSEDYYARAWATLTQARPAAKAFVFADDHEWAQTLRKVLPGSEIIGPEYDGPDYMHKFHLMRSCRHFIIANSTWGWWAAWLGASAHSMVLMPEKWFANEQANQQAQGLRVPGWLTL